MSKESRFHLTNRRTAPSMPQTVPTSATPPPSPAAAAPSSPLPRSPRHPFCFLWSPAKKAHAARFQILQIYGPARRQNEREGKPRREEGRGPRVGRSSNTKVMAAVVPSARPSLGSLKRRRRRRKGDPKRGKKHNALPPSAEDGKDLTDHARDRPRRHRPRLAYSEGALKFPDGTEPPYHSR